MNWILIAFIVLGGTLLILLAIYFSKPNKKSKDWQLPRVCSIWNRWLKLKTDHVNETGRQFGDSWVNNTCPKGNYLQKFNRTDVACVASPENGTLQLCRQQISNDDVATPFPPRVSPDHPLSPVDHWVSLSESMAVDSGTKRGNAWENSTCPSGALMQQVENEVWCVLPDTVDETNEEAALLKKS
jgi:hypothetical protein